MSIGNFIFTIFFDKFILHKNSYNLFMLRILILKGVTDMCHKENNKQQPHAPNNIKPSDIKGKIEVPDTRKRKDGPGGN